MYIVKYDHIDPSLFFMVLGVEPRVLLLPDAISLRGIPSPDMIIPRNTPLFFNKARVLPHSKPGQKESILFQGSPCDHPEHTVLLVINGLLL